MPKIHTLHPTIRRLVAASGLFDQLISQGARFNADIDRTQLLCALIKKSG